MTIDNQKKKRRGDQNPSQKSTSTCFTVTMVLIVVALLAGGIIGAVFYFRHQDSKEDDHESKQKSEGAKASPSGRGRSRALNPEHKAGLLISQLDRFDQVEVRKNFWQKPTGFFGFFKEKRHFQKGDICTIGKINVGNFMEQSKIFIEKDDHEETEDESGDTHTYMFLWKDFIACFHAIYK